MGLAGLEPATKRLWAVCSNQLSYKPKKNDNYCTVILDMGDEGLEPTTPSV